MLVACGDDDGPLPDAGADAGEDAGVDAGPGCTWEGEPAEPLTDPARHTPRWAFEPWISKDISDRDDTYSFVQGFLDRDIPVGVVVIDSPWETHYNTFVPNPSRYPEFPEMVEWLHERDVRIVMWITQMVNRFSFDAEDGGDAYRGPSPNYSEGQRCGFFVNDGRDYAWWKGNGAALDFFNPLAVAWWREQQDLVLDAGIDGWKLDFGESYIRRAPFTHEDVTTAAGPRTHQEYSEAYYADFLRYGVARRGRDFLTMVRAWDVSYDHPARFHARPEHAPVVWVGDNHRDWTGVVDVLDHSFRSAVEGYVVIGSDVGGYLDRREDNLLEIIPYDSEVFGRWIALAGMMPFFQLHGRANLEPWNVEDAERILPAYTYWATLHSEMVPFWYSLAEEAYAGRATMMAPVVSEVAGWDDDWRFLVGDAFLVAPIFEPGDATRPVGVRDVALPALPEGDRWHDWYELTASYAGGTTLEAFAGAEAFGRVPVFVRSGAIVPLRPRNAVTGFGVDGANVPTVLAWESVAGSTFVVHDEDDETTTLSFGSSAFTLSRVREPTLLRLVPRAVPASVRVDGEALASAADLEALRAAASGYWIDGEAVWVKLAASAAELVVTLGD